jgi:hypothetical protein
MMECVDAFQEFLERKCEGGDGSAEVDMFSNLANVTAVSQSTPLPLLRLSSHSAAFLHILPGRPHSYRLRRVLESDEDE